MVERQRDFTYQRIEALTSTGEPESVVLEYKREVDKSHRAELAKDVSAFANAQGGLYLIGVEEKEGRPVHPPAGVNRMIGSAKIEEWIGQVLASNIAPRVPVRLDVIDHPSDKDRCFVVIHVAASPQAPHMVTTDGYNRYYRRDLVEARPASEYEVREMFYRSTRSRTERTDFLFTRGIGRDPGTDGSYCQNTLTWRLERDETAGGQSFVMLTACPESLIPGAVPVMTEAYWGWVTGRDYPPKGYRSFIPRAARPVAGGSLHYDDRAGRYERYLFVRDTGYVEIGMARARYHRERGLTMFPASELMARYWQLVLFAADLYGEYGLYWPFDVGLHLAGTRDSVLSDLGRGWLGPEDADPDELLRCLDHNVEIWYTLPSFDTDESLTEEAIRSVAEQLDHAYGSRYGRVFNRNPPRRFKFEPDQ